MGLRLCAVARTAVLMCGLTGMVGGCGDDSAVSQATQGETDVMQQRNERQQRYLEHRARLLQGELKGLDAQQRRQRLRELKRTMIDKGEQR